MAWIKLTALDETKFLLNTNKIIVVCVERNVIILSEGGVRTDAKESLEEIEAMLNKNEQPIASEAVAKDFGRNYIGQHEPFQSPDSSFNKRGI